MITTVNVINVINVIKCNKYNKHIVKRCQTIFLLHLQTTSIVVPIVDAALLPKKATFTIMKATFTMMKIMLIVIIVLILLMIIRTQYRQ
jgi:hypothetical protein